VELGDHGQRRAAAGRGQGAGVAVGEDPPGAGQQVGAVGGDRVAGRLLFGLDRAGLAQGRGVRVRGPRRTNGASDPVDRVGQVDRGRAGVAERGAGAIEGIWRCGQLDRDPVGRRRPDQGRAADGQPADRGGYLTGGAQLELVLAPRQLGLVDRL